MGRLEVASRAGCRPSPDWQVQVEPADVSTVDGQYGVRLDYGVEVQPGRVAKVESDDQDVVQQRGAHLRVGLPGTVVVEDELHD